ncbi:MAG: DUF2997 domain-containing protein [Candidatus Eremiobacterota bacterium]
MEIQEVQVIIGPDGQVKIEVNGVKGMSCLDVTAELEKALGTVKNRELTPEAHEQVEVRTDTRVWGS